MKKQILITDWSIQGTNRKKYGVLVANNEKEYYDGNDDVYTEISFKLNDYQTLEEQIREMLEFNHDVCIDDETEIIIV